jgi:hypothetical protein
MAQFVGQRNLKTPPLPLLFQYHSLTIISSARIAAAIESHVVIRQNINTGLPFLSMLLAQLYVAYSQATCKTRLYNIQIKLKNK